MKYIPEEDYKKILETMPVCCVDLIINKNNKVLLIKRNNEPEKGAFWIPGGRLLKGEKLKEAAIRLAKRETGINVKIEKLIGVYDYFSDKSRLPDLRTGTHNPSILFLVKPNQNKFEVTLDSDHSDHKWVGRIDRDLEPYIKKMLEDSGVFN
jgi:colanic acid biosynthesis protein WcaH